MQVMMVESLPVYDIFQSSSGILYAILLCLHSKFVVCFCLFALYGDVLDVIIVASMIDDVTSLV